MGNLPSAVLTKLLPNDFHTFYVSYLVTTYSAVFHENQVINNQTTPPYFDNVKSKKEKKKERNMANT